MQKKFGDNIVHFVMINARECHVGDHLILQFYMIKVSTFYNQVR